VRLAMSLLAQETLFLFCSLREKIWLLVGYFYVMMCGERDVFLAFR
jgi:hypothetical protein